MKTPHVHAALIKAWADGAQIQFQRLYGEWQDVPEPQWEPMCNYRVKPEPIPDIVVYPSLVLKDGFARLVWPVGPNLKCTFDGESHKLKAIELI